MISTFVEWLNESQNDRNTLSIEEYNHIKTFADSQPEYDDEEDEDMPKIIAEYLEEIKATDPLSKKYIEFWNKTVEKANGDETEAIYLINDMMYDPSSVEDKIDPKISDMIDYPFSIEATPGPGVTYDDVSIAIEQLGEYRAEQDHGDLVYCPNIRGWVSDSDYYNLDRSASEIVNEYNDIVVAIKGKDVDYLNTLDPDVALAIGDKLPLDVMDKYRGRINARKYGLF